MTAKARVNQSKQESDIFTKKIKSGLKNLKARKQQLEKSLGDKVHEAKELATQLATQLDAQLAATQLDTQLET